MCYMMTSKELSKELKREHSSIMKSIRLYIKRLDDSGIDSKKYFEEIKKNKNVSYYNITLEGYEFALREHAKTKKLRKSRNKDYKFEVGKIYHIGNGDIQILEQLRDDKKNDKMYKFICLECNSEDTKLEYVLTKNIGCPVCSNKKVIKGVNDIYTTHNYLVKYFKNKSDTYCNTYGSGQKVDMICPECKTEKHMTISDLYYQGFACPRCGDGLSYPTKFIFEMLMQLNIKFQTELNKTTFEWCDKYRYDFYLPDYNMIIEAHGLQHYTNIFRGRKVNNRDNDKMKRNNAFNNGILNYIELDCRKSDKEWIKESLIKSNVFEILHVDKNNVDWDLCELGALSSKLIKVCELWNTGNYTTLEIEDTVKLNRTTVQRYLNKGHDIGLCNYNWKEKMIRKNKSKGKHVMMYSENKEKIREFPSTAELARESIELFGVVLIDSRIANACRNKTTYKGYYFEYI